jgi:pentatricopeptide repeat protein
MHGTLLKTAKWERLLLQLLGGRGWQRTWQRNTSLGSQPPHPRAVPTYGKTTTATTSCILDDLFCSYWINWSSTGNDHRFGMVGNGMIQQKVVHSRNRLTISTLPIRCFSSTTPIPQDLVDLGLDNTTTTAAVAPISWNDQVRIFLETILRKNSASSKLPDLKHDVLQSLVQLLKELLQITAFALQKIKSTGSSNTFVDDQQTHDDSFFWAYMGVERDLSCTTTAVSSTTNLVQEKKIETSLVFALLDLLVEMERSKGPAFMKHMMTEWSMLSKCLNPILHLWKDEYNNMSKRSPDFAKNSIPTPSQVLAKLDNFRQHSNLLLPDVRSYNIILDAVAITPSNNVHHRRRGLCNNGIDIAFCERVWDWMWQEANLDSLVRPDIVTLRTLFKAHVATGHKLAPERCETLMQKWLNHNSMDNDLSSANYQSYSRQQKVANAQISLIHVWATYNPCVAHSYLKRLADSFLLGTTHVPPDTITWNRVISSYAIVHSLPDKGHQVLEDFWTFYQTVHKLQSDRQDDDTLSSLPSNASKVSPPNLSSYNSVLEGYALKENAVEANKIFSRVEMASSTSPSIATYTSIIKANGRDLETVDRLAKQCMALSKEQGHNRSGGAKGDSEAETTTDLVIDHAFFHAWLKACAKARDVAAAKRVWKHLRSCQLEPLSATYLAFLDVFLSSSEPQEAIEWLLAYAKIERWTEDDIVSWTIRVLEWYQLGKRNGRNEGDVDTQVFLEVLFENGFVTTKEAVERLLSHVTTDQAMAIWGWIPGQYRQTLKFRAILMRKLALDTSKSDLVEKMFLEWTSQHLADQNLSATTIIEPTNQAIVQDMCTTVIVAWSKRVKMTKVRYWLDVIQRNPLLPPLSRIAQMNVVQAYCQRRDPVTAEAFVLEMVASYKESHVDSIPDLAMKNVVLKTWAREGNGSRAYAFLQNHIEDADTISYNTVTSAFCQQGDLDQAENLVRNFVDKFLEDPVETRRPDRGTFVILLAAWRRSLDPNAAVRAEAILGQMYELFERGILLEGPNYKSYAVVLDTWEKSPREDAGERAKALLSSSSFRNDTKLIDQVRRIQCKSRRNRTLEEQTFGSLCSR